MLGIVVSALLFAGGIAGFLATRTALDRDAHRVDVARAASAAAALDAALTRSIRGLESMLSLIDVPEHRDPVDFARFARGTVGAEDFTPTLRVVQPEPDRRRYVVDRAVMTGHDDALRGTVLAGPRALVDAFEDPAAAFGVAASRPTTFHGRRGLFLVGPAPQPVLDERPRLVASFIPAERIAPPAGAVATVDGEPLVASGPPPADEPVTRRLALAGRRFAVVLAPAERSFASTTLPWLILGFATVLAALAGLAVSRNLQGQRLTRERARQRLDVMAAAAGERGRLSRDLHDSVSQALFSMTLQARTAQLGLAREGLDPDGAVGRPVRELAALTRSALAEIRALIFELRPRALDQEGVVVALQKHAAALAAREQRSIAVTGPSLRVAMEPVVEEHLFRIALEAVHNAVKHADAEHIEIRVSAPSEDHVRIDVADDGRGFDPEIRVTGHYGLDTMRERAKKIDSAMHISSTPGGGTTVTIDVPLSNNRIPT